MSSNVTHQPGDFTIEGGTRFPLPSPRFVVTELDGFLQIGGGHKRPAHAKPGASFAVVDRHWNYRLVGNFRSEDYRRAAASSTVEQASHAANRLAHRLNGGSDPEPLALFEPHDNFRATCPRCGRICDYLAIYCAEDGTRLYPAWSGRYGKQS